MESYLLTSHPESMLGKQERLTRKEFQSFIATLDSAVLSNGEIDLNHVDLNVILSALNGVSDFCNGTYVEIEVEESKKETDGEEKDDDEEVAEEESKKGATQKKKTKSEKSLAFLTLLHSSNGILTLLVSYLTTTRCSCDDFCKSR